MILCPFIILTEIPTLYNFIQQESATFLICGNKHVFLQKSKGLLQHIHYCCSNII